jgi:uncharacterized protein GlcG (DUF336 family)
MSSRLVLAVLLLTASASAQTPPAPAKPAVNFYATPIGAAISLEAAKRVAAVAAAEAQKNNWLMAIAVVDPAGTLIYYEKADDTQLGSAKVAIDKARSAALYKRPTKAFEDAVKGGGLGVRILRLEGAVPLEGGMPLRIEGKLVGAIGVSGDLSEHDGQCANAAVASLEKSKM